VNRLFLILLVGLVQMALATDFPQMVLGKDGAHGRRGGGIAEQNFTFAYQNLGKFIDICLKTEACQLNDKDRAVLKFISAELPNENPKLFFSEDQSLFSDNQPAPRIAVTGNKVGSPISINIKLLYPPGEDGRPAPLGIGEAISVLVHELGHHNGDPTLTHDYLDSLGIKVRAGYLKRAQVTRFPAYFMPKIHRADLTVESLNTATLNQLPVPNATTLVVLSDGKNIYDLTQELLKLRHPENNKPLETVFFDNIHWVRSYEFGPLDGGEQTVTLKLYGSAVCNPFRIYRTWNHDLILSLRFHVELGPPEYISLIPGAPPASNLANRGDWRYIPGSAKAEFIECAATNNKHPECH
jgi:hypothetical protein